MCNNFFRHIYSSQRLENINTFILVGMPYAILISGKIRQLTVYRGLRIFSLYCDWKQGITSEHWLTDFLFSHLNMSQWSVVYYFLLFQRHTGQLCFTIYYYKDTLISCVLLSIITETCSSINIIPTLMCSTTGMCTIPLSSVTCCWRYPVNYSYTNSLVFPSLLCKVCLLFLYWFLYVNLKLALQESISQKSC